MARYRYLEARYQYLEARYHYFVARLFDSIYNAHAWMILGEARTASGAEVNYTKEFGTIPAPAQQASGTWYLIGGSPNGVSPIGGSPNGGSPHGGSPRGSPIRISSNGVGPSPRLRAL